MRIFRTLLAAAVFTLLAVAPASPDTLSLAPASSDTATPTIAATASPLALIFAAEGAPLVGSGGNVGQIPT